MTKFEKFLFIVIFFIALFLRFWHLDKFPVSLNWDEVSHGYNAYSLLKTGKDQWNMDWPIFNFRAYGDYPTTLNMYLTIPFVYFLGLNEISIRLPSALLGFGLVIVSFFLGKLLFKNTKAALLLMFITAISPWTLFPSRAVFQSTVAQFFFALGILLVLYSIKNKSKLILPGLVCLALSTYGYHNTRIVVPLMSVLILLIFWKSCVKFLFKNKIFSLFSILIFIAILLPQFLNFFDSSSRARSRWVFIINPASINTINENRNNFNGHPLIAKLVYNKPTYFVSEVSKNYLEFLNPKTLFFTGTQNYQFNIPNTGVLFPVLLPFFYLGILVAVKNSFKKDKLSLTLIAWSIIGLIPAVITSGDFPIIRAMTLLPLPQIFITLGIILILKYLKQTNIKLIFILFLILINSIQAFDYMKNYFNNYSTDYSQAWQYGYKEAVNFAKEKYQKYDQIIVTKKYGEAHEYFLFFWPWDPSSYLNDPNKVWDFHADWYWVDSFDKFKFVNDWEIKSITTEISSDKNTLLITSPNNYNQSNAKLLKTINFLDKKPAFDILEIYGQKK